MKQYKIKLKSFEKLLNPIKYDILTFRGQYCNLNISRGENIVYYKFLLLKK